MTFRKTIIYLLIVLTASFSIYFLTYTQQSFWIIWATFIFALISLGNTFSQRLSFIALSVIAAAIAAFIAGFCTQSIIALAVYLLLLTALCIYFVERYPEYSLLAFIVPIFGILGIENAPALKDHVSKLLFILLGGAIVILAQLIFARRFKPNSARYWLAVGIDDLKMLCNEIFSAFQPAYPDNIYIFERRIHQQKKKFLYAAKKMREFKLNTQAVENLYEILLECAQLRSQVSDATIFSLCTQEMHDLLTAIDSLFNQLRELIHQQINTSLDTAILTQQISRFDEINEHVLQVTAREPAVFILFSSSIKKLAEALNVFPSGLSSSEAS